MHFLLAQGKKAILPLPDGIGCFNAINPTTTENGKAIPYVGVAV